MYFILIDSKIFAIYLRLPPSVLPLFFFFGHAPSMQKFLGLGWNLYCSSNPSHSSENAKSLTY